MVRHHQYAYALPLIFGMLVFLRTVRGGEGLARLPLAIWVGYGAGYALTYLPRTLRLQVTGSMLPPDRLNNIVILATLVGGLCYFLFTFGQQGPVRRLASFGRYAIMLALGASFGGAVLYRYTIFLGRVSFLLHTWLHL